MREIKFRGWDCSENKWKYFEGIFSANPSHRILDKNWGPSVWHKMKWECQYTGLKDSKGAEIYEGDILMTSALTGNFIIKWDERTAGFRVHRIGEDYGGMLPEKQNMKSIWEIIGNIYENPTLLEEGK